MKSCAGRLHKIWLEYERLDLDGRGISDIAHILLLTNTICVSCEQLLIAPKRGLNSTH